MGLVTNDQFLSSLSKLYENSKDKGTVYVTMKRFSHVKKKEAKETPEVLTSPDTEFPCLVRAVCGKGGKKKISTLVHPNDTDRFQEAYTNIIRLHMDSLKKKERTKKVKKPKAPTT
ncbi:hypothetical protein HDV00_004556 [Rhizophlyctis rosea]|nr:hypothetical protein HDV00_004556 [Rhizophlyctis rosea]